MAFFSPNKSISFSENLINNNNNNSNGIGSSSAASSPIYCEKTAPNTPSSLDSSKTIHHMTSSSLKHPKKLSKNISSGSFFSRTRKNFNRGISHRAKGETSFAHQESFDSSTTFSQNSKNIVKCSTSKSADNNLVNAGVSFSSSFKQSKSKKRIFSMSHTNNFKPTSTSRQITEANTSKRVYYYLLFSNKRYLVKGTFLRVFNLAYKFR